MSSPKSYPIPRVFTKIMVTVAILASPMVLTAQFSGVYDQQNWTFTSQDLSAQQADGSIDLSNMPTGFTITGNDDGLEGANSLYSIIVPEDGTIKFRWSYTTTDGPQYDKAGYRLNGTGIELTDPEGSSDQSGEIAVNVSAGDEFAFFVDGTDACCGRGFMTIEAFSAADNTLPTIDGLPTILSVLNPGLVTVDLTGITAGILEPTQVISITSSSNNTSVIPNPTVNYTSPDETGSLTFTPVTDAFGDATVTINVMDDGGTANGSIDVVSITFDISITSNFPPQITSISDVESQINEAIGINLSGISAGPGETQAITVTATSSNQAVIADGDIAVTYISPDATGSLSITPVANTSGETIISVTVSDDGGVGDNGKNETTTFFNVHVLPNEEPTINEVSDLNLFVNTIPDVINLSGIDDGDSEVDQVLTLVATSSNPGLIPDPILAYTSPDETGTLTLSPVADQSGTATITVTLSDDGGTSNGGIDQTSFSFDVTILGNFPPEIDPLSNIVMGINETGRIIDLTGISDGIIGNSEELTITATSSNTSVVDPSGIIVDYASPETTGSLELALVADAIGESTITVTVTDNGGTSNGGVNISEETFIVRVVANRAPVISQVDDLFLDINALEQSVDLEGIDAGENSDYQVLSITAASDNLGLIPDPTVTYTSPETTGSLVFTPVTDAIGVANITITVTDDGGTLGGGINTSTMTFQVSATGNQPPSMNEIDDVTQTSVGNFSVDLSGISDGTGLTQMLTITAVSDNPTIIPDPTVNYVGGEATGSLDFVPTDFGDATITVTITDDGGTENGGVDTFSQTFNIHIGENTPPNITDYDSGDDLDGATFYVSAGLGSKAIIFGVDDSDHNITTVSAVGNNPELNDILTVNFTPGSYLGGLTISADANQLGSVDFDISVVDDGGTENNGIDTRIVTVTVVLVDPFTYTEAISTNSFDVPEEGMPPVFTDGSAEYHIQPFTIDQSGLVYMENQEGDFNAFLSLYAYSFDPANSLNNAIAAGNAIAMELEAGIQYILVTSGSGAENESFTNSIGVLNGSVGFGFLPNLNFIEDVVLDEDGSVTIPLSGISDGNGNTNNLTLSAASEAFSAFDFTDNLDGTASLLATTAADFNGMYMITVTVTGENGNTFDRNFYATINAVNDAPEFTLSQGALMVGQIDRNGTFDITSTQNNIPSDETGQTILYTISPTTVSFADVTFDGSTGALQLSNFGSAIDQQVFTITANDQQSVNNTAIQMFTLDISTVNTAPEFTLSSTSLQVLYEDRNSEFVVSATPASVPSDESFQVVEYMISPSTVSFATVSFDTSTGQLTLSEFSDDIDAQQVFTITADDQQPENNTATQTLNLSVLTVLGILNENAIDVFPNPSTSELYINSTEVKSLEIYTLEGKIIRTISKPKVVDVSNMESGIYMLRLKNERGEVISINRIVKN